ncbi:MAG: hypothetical protein M1309_01360 [Actinobacteria bacterium]|nr:hypothetical protein [Actinomycetota bacterium]
MAGAAQQDWGFTEITRKFERRRPVRPRAPGRRRAAAPSTLYVGVWLGVIAVLLIGLVGLRVSLLYKDVAFNNLIRERNDLTVQNSQLESNVSMLSSPARIQQIAAGTLGMVPAGKIQYVYINPVDNRQFAELTNQDAGGNPAPSP